MEHMSPGRQGGYKGLCPACSRPTPTPTRRSPRRRFSAAFERQLPKDWTVFHSRRIVLPRRGPGPVVERELDFLVIDPAPRDRRSSICT